MYDDLILRLRELHPEEFGDAWDFAFACQQAMNEAADAIEALAAFKAQITDGHFYCMRDGVLYEAKVEAPKGKTIQLPRIEYEEGE